MPNQLFVQGLDFNCLPDPYVSQVILERRLKKDGSVKKLISEGRKQENGKGLEEKKIRPIVWVK